jgi:hypothetical protein
MKGFCDVANKTISKAEEKAAVAEKERSVLQEKYKQVKEDKESIESKFKKLANESNTMKEVKNNEVKLLQVEVDRMQEEVEDQQRKKQGLTKQLHSAHARLRRARLSSRTSSRDSEPKAERRPQPASESTLPEAAGEELEGEVFSTHHLQDLQEGRCSPTDDPSRLSELARRNTLAPAHLKSAYAIESQFCQDRSVTEESIRDSRLPRSPGALALPPSGTKRSRSASNLRCHPAKRPAPEATRDSLQVTS